VGASGVTGERGKKEGQRDQTRGPVEGARKQLIRLTGKVKGGGSLFKTLLSQRNFPSSQTRGIGTRKAKL